MRLVVLHNAVTEKSSPDERDVLFQSRAVSEALIELGHEVITIACGLDLNVLRHRLLKIKPDLVFNLVESLDGHGRLIHVAPFLMDSMGTVYTGASAEALYATSNKISAKERMQQYGSQWEIFTPGWIGPYSLLQSGRICFDTSEKLARSLWIIKSVWEHASLGLGDDAIICPDRIQDIIDIMKERAPGLGGDCFAEWYIEGREINLSLLEGESGPEVLPPAEIVFKGYAADKPRIIGYQAKWEVDSFEYSHTPRGFDFSSADDFLLQEMRKIALRCWDLFHLKGYARVDFRVDEQGHPWVLEINANPCLSPDAGFAAALARAGISYARAIERIVEAAGRPVGGGAALIAVQDGTASPSANLLQKPDEVTPVFRYEVLPEDASRVSELLSATGFFYPDEIDTAISLIEERIARGPLSGYFFVFCENGSELIGYTCFGPIPCTQSSYDVYWIAVSPEFHGRKWGRKLLAETERLITEAGGTHVYIDTSGRSQYVGSRMFYEHCGYRAGATLPDFYGPEDGKVIYQKSLISA